jgi:uncharacterized protein involved in exopolysaccharide biosynthesis
MNRLADLRAEYANLVAATKYRGETLKAVEQELSESRASQRVARTASMISLVDTPDAGTRPVGPGKTMIAAAGFGGGLMIAAAIVFLTVVPGTQASPRRRGAFVREAAPPQRVASRKLTLRQALERVAGNPI